MSAHGDRPDSVQIRDRRIVEGFRSGNPAERQKAMGEFAAVFENEVLKYFRGQRLEDALPGDLWGALWAKLLNTKFFNHGDTRDLTSSLAAYVQQIAVTVLSDHREQVWKHRRILNAAKQAAPRMEGKPVSDHDEISHSTIVNGLSDAEHGRLYSELHGGAVSRASRRSLSHGLLTMVVAEAKSRGCSQIQLAKMCGTTAVRMNKYIMKKEPIPRRLLPRLVEIAKRWNCV